MCIFTKISKFCFKYIKYIVKTILGNEMKKRKIRYIYVTFIKN